MQLRHALLQRLLLAEDNDPGRAPVLSGHRLADEAIQPGLVVLIPGRVFGSEILKGFRVAHVPYLLLKRISDVYPLLQFTRRTGKRDQ